MSIYAGSGRLAALNVSPPAPPSGYCLIYFKSDNILYIKDSAGNEISIGSASAITALTGEATATGPGSASVTLDNDAVIGKLLTGFTPGPNSTVLATDTILQAVQKLQSQISSIAGTSLIGDVTGTLGATVVSFVGAKTAAQVVQSVNDTTAATSVNTPSTIIKRDVSGKFVATEITSSLIGNVTGNVTGNVSGSAASFTGSLVGDVTGIQGATVVSQVSGKTSAQVSTSVDDTLAATSVATPSTIVKRDSNADMAVRDLTARKTLPSVVSLIDGASIATDAALGNVFTVTIAGNRTFAAPTNPVADQRITYKIRQDAVGGRVITWNAAFNFGVDLSGVPNSTSPDIFDYYGFQYNATTSRWDCLAISRGY
jgi:hypothetical protein